MPFSFTTRLLTAAETEEARVWLQCANKPDGDTPPRRVSWALGPDTPMTDDESVTPADIRRLAVYARYRASAKGRARTYRSPAGQRANYREYRKRLRAKIADAPRRGEALLATFEAAGASAAEIAEHRATLAPILARREKPS
jgi:hypothetical protein